MRRMKIATDQSSAEGASFRPARPTRVMESLAHRIRWPNVAAAVAVVGLLVVVLTWPHGGDAAQPLPPRPRPAATPEPATPAVSTTPAYEPEPRAAPRPRARAHPTRHRPARHAHAHAQRRRTPRRAPQRAAAPPAPAAAPS